VWTTVDSAVEEKNIYGDKFSLFKVGVEKVVFMKRLSSTLHFLFHRTLPTVSPPIPTVPSPDLPLPQVHYL